MATELCCECAVSKHFLYRAEPAAVGGFLHRFQSLPSPQAHFLKGIVQFIDPRSLNV